MLGIRCTESNGSDGTMTPKNDADPRVLRAHDAATIRGFLIRSRFPFFTFTPAAGGTRVTVRDMRFGGDSPARFEASTVVADGGRADD